MNKIVKKRNSNFVNSWKFIVESKKYIYSIVVIFILCGIFGFVFHDKLTFIDELLKGLIDKTKGLGIFSLISFIFFNNLQSAFFGMILGIFFGIMPLINAVSNGVVLGYVLEKVYKFTGFNDFWRILPHGIFELPAIFISLGLGMRLGLFIFSKDKKKKLFVEVKKAIFAFLFIVVPLLIIAAIIEGTLIIFMKS